MGKVTDIVVDPAGEEFPVCVMVQFDRYSGPTVNGSFPIGSTQSTFSTNGDDCKRIQFPLILAFSMTIHKAQGLTLENVVLNIGEKERSLV